VGETSLCSKSGNFCFPISSKIQNYIEFIMFFGRKKRFYIVLLKKHFRNYHAAHLIFSLCFLFREYFVVSLTQLSLILNVQS
jgi:hypothetical protein